MRTRRGGVALLVGVDRYPLLEPKYQLESCAHDARLVAEILRGRFGFPEDGVELLLDEAATRDGILAGLAALCGRARPDEAVVFYYSGHGSRVRDREGDEPDGWDEAIVPHDGGRQPHPFRDITDDEIYVWILETSAITPHITVIADTCYSGTLARAGTRRREKWVPPDERPLAELPPSPVSAALLPHRTRDAAPGGLLPPSERYVLLAACRDGESAGVLPPAPGAPRASVFTFHLCRELRRAPAGATYRDLLAPLRAAVAAEVQDQTPQLEGARDRLLFGGTGRAPEAYLPVVGRTGDRVRLGGGAAHGVTSGSLWAVSPGGVREGGAAEPRPGLVLVDRVEAVSSEAEIVEEARPITGGDRAVERAKGPTWMRMAVTITESAARLSGGPAVAQRIVGSPLLLLVHDAERAEVRIEPMAPRGAEGVVEGTATAGETGAAGEPAWAARDGEGDLIFAPTPAQLAQVSTLVTDLERLARFRNLLRLADEDLGNPLRGRVEVQLLCQQPGGEFCAASPDPLAGGAVYHEGDRLALRIVQRSAAPLYLHVLDLGLAGAIAPMFPVAGANEALQPGRELLIGIRPGDEISVSLPQAFAKLARACGLTAVAGREFLKVFATTHEADLTWWRQPGFGAERGGRALASRLDRVLWRAMHGARLRDDAPARAGEHWTVVTLDFLVHARA
jgi:hypothetical protein